MRFYSKVIKTKRILNKGIKTVGTIDGVKQGGVFEDSDEGELPGMIVITVAFTDENNVSRKGKTYPLKFSAGQFLPGQEIGIEYIQNSEMIALLKNFDIAAAKAINK